MEILIVFGSALWLGILTSISPCPLASNIAAVSFLSKKIVHPAFVFVSGLAYTAGRMASYALLGWLIIHSLLNIPQTAQFLQKHMGQFLGPVLVLTGLVLLEVFSLRLPHWALSQKQQNRLAESGFAGAFLLGFIFALAFCPVSAALFFGSLIPLALNSRAPSLLPLIYGAGTGLPVFLFATAIALSVTSLSRWFQKIRQMEYYMRRVTGVVFILVGLYYTGIYIFKFF